MGAKELQATLQDNHNCTIAYETMWKGKEKVVALIYGSWENNFQLLFRWIGSSIGKMPDSIIEIDVEEGKIYFR
jgi:hypothetical protein